MEEEDDDFYAPDDGQNEGDTAVKSEGARDSKSATAANGHGEDDELEEGEEEEEEEESDSDIDIITERKDEPPLPQPNQAVRSSAIRIAPAKAGATDQTTGPKSIKADPSKTPPPKSGADFPPVRISKIDVDAKPIHEATGKPITKVDLDADFKDDEKPWRRPGTDTTDYFNYGFDEFTWASYCLRQDTMRAEISAEKKQMQDFTTMMDMGGVPQIPGMPGVPGASNQGAMSQLPGMGDIPPEMQAMMAQMMAQGADPSQMDPAMFAAMQQAMVGQGGSGSNQGQNFGAAQQSFSGQGQNQQQMGFGYDQGMGGDANRNRQGNFGQRGRGGNRRNW